MLFCITANYTPQALEAMGKNPNTNRREAVEKLVTAAGGKLDQRFLGSNHIKRPRRACRTMSG